MWAGAKTSRPHDIDTSRPKLVNIDPREKRKKKSRIGRRKDYYFSHLTHFSCALFFYENIYAIFGFYTSK
jgi:hypothetical protein